jgi:acyl-CoA synthetase (NDP forming)
LHADRKNGVVIQNHSGGPGDTAADACGRSGPKLPRIPQETTGKPKPLIPKTAGTVNPANMIFSKNPSENYFNIPDVLFNNAQTKIREER